MKKCPFCNKEVTFSFPTLMYLPGIKKWSFMHHCSKNMTVMIYGETEEAILDEWDGCGFLE